MEKPDLSKIPLSPGVYLYKSRQGRVLYVGKAKQLRKRVSSYFRKASGLAPKTVAMLEKAIEIETISTDTENEALLLEANLIKKHRPPYNIVLRDDKEYLLFRIASDVPFPRLEVVRQIRRGKKQGNAKYFGPYSSGRDARATWKAIHRNFPLRRCSDTAFKNRSRPCLYHHIGQCLAPCVLPVEPQSYTAVIDKVVMLLQGRSRELIKNLKIAMTDAAERLDFEYAARLRDEIRAAESTVEKQSVVFEKERDLDAVGFAETERGLALGLLFIRGGTLLGSRNFFWPGLGFESAEELLSTFLLQFYAEAGNIPPQIVLPWLPGNRKSSSICTKSSPASASPLNNPVVNAEQSHGLCAEQSHSASQERQIGLPEAPPKESAEEDFESDLTELPDITVMEAALTALRSATVRLSLPRSDAEGRLVSLASTNARNSAIQQVQLDIGELLGTAFSAAHPISRIEAVDISHTSGKDTKAAMVVFDDGKPLHNAWRSYSLGDGGGDDYAMLAAWAERRINAGAPWPDLILIDGGRGQLGVVQRIFSEHWYSQGQDIPFLVAGIAKARDEAGHSDRRAGNISDRIFIPGRSNPLNLKAGSVELLYLQNIRNHVHDFVIGRHRKARASHALQGELNRIPGFGARLISELWKHFDSVEEMLDADDATLAKVPGLGEKKRQALRAHLQLIINTKP